MTDAQRETGIKPTSSARGVLFLNRPYGPEELIIPVSIARLGECTPICSGHVLHRNGSQLCVLLDAPLQPDTGVVVDVSGTRVSGEVNTCTTEHPVFAVELTLIQYEPDRE